jgi:ABC-2 type transport system ATP-binding protein
VIIIDHGTQVFDGTLDHLSREFSDSRRLKLVLSENADQGRLEKFGKVVSLVEGEAILEVPRDRIASTTAAALQELAVIDIAIEEVPIEDVIAEVFSRQPASTS